MFLALPVFSIKVTIDVLCDQLLPELLVFHCIWVGRIVCTYLTHIWYLCTTKLKVTGNPDLFLFFCNRHQDPLISGNAGFNLLPLLPELPEFKVSEDVCCITKSLVLMSAILQKIKFLGNFNIHLNYCIILHFILNIDTLIYCV